MNFSAYAIRNPVVIILLFGLLTLAGLWGFKTNQVQEFPDIELPVVSVVATLEGAAPAQLETEVARKIEDSVASVQGVKHIHTSVHDGEVSIKVEFIIEKDPSDALTEVRDAVTRIRSDLPGDLKEPVISKAATAGRVVQVLSASSTVLDEQEVSWFVDDKLTKALLSVPGVGSVKRVGGVTREVLVELDTMKMAALHVSAAEVSRRLKQVQQEAPGGRGDVGGAEQSVRTIATVRTAAELAALELPLADGRRVRLDQLATLTDTVAEQRSLALQDGRRVVGVEVYRSKGASELDVAAGVRAVVARLGAENPQLKLAQEVDNSVPVKENFDGSMHMLYEGAILAVLVVWWFLRDWRATIVAAAALPLSAIPAFLGMAWFGFTLNIVTLLALALVVGILVDDAIVEVENISRHLRMGKTPMQAALEAADEIGLAVVATTFALVAVFLPTAFMGGIPGKFFKQFGWTAVVAILASLLVARLVTPVMAAYMLKGGLHEEQDGKLMNWYMRTMRWCLHHRAVTAAGAALFFVGSIALVGLLPTGFVPSADRAQTQLTIELPPGSTLKETTAVAERAREIARGVKGVQRVFSSVGGGAAGDAFNAGTAAEARRAILTLTLVHRTERDESVREVEAQLRSRLAAIPGARFGVGLMGDNGVKMQIVLQGDDPAALASAAQRAERELRTLKGIGTVSSSASLARPEIIVRPDFARAADLGVTSASIAETVRIATAGDYSTGLPKLNLTERQVPVRVKLPDAARADLASLERLTLPGRDGPVLLAAVARLTMDSGPAEIKRLDRRRNVTLDVELGSRDLGAAYQEAMALPALKHLPPGVRVVELGDAQEMQALFVSFGIAMAVGVLCIWGVLVLLFKDFMQPVTILAALPLSIGGAFVALLVTHSAMSMPSMIGLIMLMGVVTKNSILLVEYAIVARREGMSRFDALVDACHKRSRPIVMTTIAMGAGMLPLALGMGDADPSFRAPMAIAVIGGLVTSTLLSLLVVPAVFTYIDDLQLWIVRRFRQLTITRSRGLVAQEVHP
ncbi:efflux RND transporter permease subunit [Ramlibacter albus]|uniref:Efflux RND transporter permease subunit n=1 Tax=Ramlibacter albus TaxID=2079448 RepID=A0A923M6Q8_9BURK|nr:efflux RND transporter permease subunit [Ramlibacter albus]MBC5765252.1 efflux RND transporter permease subunit [Ramlibacter albus]